MIPTKEEWNRALMDRHGAELQERFSSAAVAVCGLGGLGSHIAVTLARAGIGKLILIDFDRVEITNLHRQQYRAEQIGLYKTEALSGILRETAPYLEIEAHTEKITGQNIDALLRNGDIICEAFDDAETKAMLTDTVLQTMPDKILVAASGMAGIGSANSIRTRKITDHFYLCGDETSDVTAEGTLFSSRVMLCAAHQAHTVLRILAGKTEI